jgi:hypothetical protein
MSGGRESNATKLSFLEKYDLDFISLGTQTENPLL